MLGVKHLHAGDYRSMPWRNGKGTTTELAVGYGPGGETAGRFAWRLSLADVPDSGPFSDFTGYNRTIMMVQWDGMTLDFGPNGKAVVDRPFEPVSFKGEWETHCSLHAGPIRDLNVMVARDLARADIGVQRLGAAPPASQVMRPAAGDVLLCHALAGSARVRVGDGEAAFDLEPGETLRLDGGRAVPVEINGAGAVVLLVELTFRLSRTAPT